MHLLLIKYFNKMIFSTDTPYLNNSIDRPHLDKYNDKNSITT